MKVCFQEQDSTSHASAKCWHFMGSSPFVSALYFCLGHKSQRTVYAHKKHRRQISQRSAESSRNSNLPLGPPGLTLLPLDWALTREHRKHSCFLLCDLSSLRSFQTGASLSDLPLLSLLIPIMLATWELSVLLRRHFQSAVGPLSWS